MLKTRKLGNQGLEVSELGLGCMGMSYAYGTPDDAESIATIHRALDLGMNFFDTAEMYGPYTNEELLGRAFKNKRNEAIIATKFGFSFHNGQVTGLNSHPDNIKKFVEDSLKRLQTTHIDLLFQHRVDPNIPIEDVVGTMSDLVKEGKVRFLGLSEASASNIRRAHKTHPISALQSEYSLWERNLEPEILPLIRELNIGLVAYSPLGRGFLTGTAKRAEEYPESDYRRKDPRMQGENYTRNMKAAEAVQNLAKEKNVSPSQIAIAWTLLKGNDIVPIPGTKRRVYLDENIAAASLSLSNDEIHVLEKALAPEVVSGPRYIPEIFKFIDR